MMLQLYSKDKETNLNTHEGNIMNKMKYNAIIFLLTSLACNVHGWSPKETAQKAKNAAKSSCESICGQAKKIYHNAQNKWEEIDPATRAKILIKAGIEKINDVATYVSEYGARKQAEKVQAAGQEIDKLATYLAQNPQYAGNEKAQRLFLSEFTLTSEQIKVILQLAKQKYRELSKIA